MARVAVVGSTGQLGSDLVQVLRGEGYEVFALTHADVECTDLDVVRAVLTAVRPDIVVNCAAFVRVDDCQEQPLQAFQVNALGALYVAQVCAELGALGVYVSTDYVFDGEKGDAYTEAESPCPINVYGTSKLAGEYLVRQTCRRWLIVRVASLFGQAGARGKGGNFIDTILARVRAGESVRVVQDMRMSPTYTHDAARALERLLRQETTGLVHLTNTGACTWYEFARKILELTGCGERPEPIAAQKYPAKARRPRDSSLRSTRLDGLVQACLRPWDEALESYLVAKGYRDK
jgi:dTDP-4-dehydrorhamnose reductase